MDSEAPENPEPPECCPKCGGKETKMINIYYGNPDEIHEYTLACKICSEPLAYWGYGHWQY